MQIFDLQRLSLLTNLGGVATCPFGQRFVRKLGSSATYGLTSTTWKQLSDKSLRTKQSFVKRGYANRRFVSSESRRTKLCFVRRGRCYKSKICTRHQEKLRTYGFRCLQIKDLSESWFCEAKSRPLRGSYLSLLTNQRFVRKLGSSYKSLICITYGLIST